MTRKEDRIDEQIALAIVGLLESHSAVHVLKYQHVPRLLLFHREKSAVSPLTIGGL